MKLSMRVTPGTEIVRKGLQDTTAEAPKVGRQQLRFTAERVVRRMQAYPPERPGQRYRRTGNLFSHWSIQDAGDRYTISNDARNRGGLYPQYVVGDAYGGTQAWMHAGRWELVRNVTEEEMDKLPDDVKKLLVLVARRNRLEATAI